MRLIAGSALLAAAFSVAAAPCSGIDRSLPEADRARLAPLVAAQLNVPSADVLSRFRSGRWSIVYVDTHAADAAYLFFDGDPAERHFITLWSGAAAPFERSRVLAWVTKNAPGIPDHLAGCFASQVSEHGAR